MGEAQLNELVALRCRSHAGHRHSHWTSLAGQRMGDASSQWQCDRHECHGLQVLGTIAVLGCGQRRVLRPELRRRVRFVDAELRVPRDVRGFKAVLAEGWRPCLLAPRWRRLSGEQHALQLELNMCTPMWRSTAKLNGCGVHEVPGARQAPGLGHCVSYEWPLGVYNRSDRGGTSGSGKGAVSRSIG